MNKGQKINKYSKEFKLKAVQMYLSGDYGGYLPVSNKIGLRSDRQLRDWVKLYKQLGPDEAFQDRRGKNLLERAKIRKMSLEEEVEYLRAENDYLKKWLKK